VERAKYQEYLASREWAVKREAVRQRSKGKCERCKTNDMHSVHHKTYDRVGNERLTDLQAICDPCHEFVSGKRDDDPAIKPKPTRRRTRRTIRVERLDIVGGVQSDPSRCTIQLAARRAFPDANDVIIKSGLMRVVFDDETWLYEISRNAACIPIMIDEGLRNDVEPVVFIVRDPHITKKKKAKKGGTQRRRPTDSAALARLKAGPASSAKQRSAAARMRKSLRSHFNAKPGQTRFQGVGT